MFSQSIHRLIIFTAPLVLLLAVNRVSAASVSVPSGLSVKVEAAHGDYQIVSQNPVWTFGSSLKTPLTVC